ncbi:FliM/FliN family flagellar motor switch protein [Burkholderia ubonensis]|uniref:FliM/FliN family flagellar motor switch protein n=1 Tax=Burkholderia ubonensis TaxID=101571 RepID=UPI0011607408|nr:FliM/FliN family flagellar motor switch protein [Burkholderia ubonensis]
MTVRIYRNSHRSKATAVERDGKIWSIPSVSVPEAKLMTVLSRIGSRRFTADWDARSRSRNRGDAMRLTLNIGGEHVPLYLADPRWLVEWPDHWRQACTAMQQGQLWQLRGARIRRAMELALGVNVAVSGAGIEAVPDGWMKLMVRCGLLRMTCWCEAESLVRALSGIEMSRDSQLHDIGLLKTRCRLTLRPISVPVDDYLALERGDVLLLNADNDPLLHGALSPMNADAECAVTIDRQGAVMVDGKFVKMDDAGALALVDEHVVSLVVELGTCEIPLGELANLAQGECIRLDKAVDDLAVRVTYNGQRIATGKLIDIAGLIGVRLDRVHVSRET